ncbi:MAG: hypothetical protein K0U37_04430 [Gammaproteobacteria bacterium]|nr:hypothetical protein [Gammaproteobacteria bacterium]
MKYKHALSAAALLVASNTYAGKPIIKFRPFTDTHFSLARNSTTTVRYWLTNESSKPHTLEMKAVKGFIQTTTGKNRCSSPFTLAGGASCFLEFEVNGSQLASNVTQGPEIFDVGSRLQGYQPSAAASLDIKLTNALTVASIAALNAPLNLFVKGPISTLKIKNTSTNLIATNLVVNFAGTPLEGKVESVSGTCQKVLPQGVCQLRFKPIIRQIQNSLPTSLGTTSGTATLGSEDATSTAEEITASEYNVGDIYTTSTDEEELNDKGVFEVSGMIACLSNERDVLNFLITKQETSPIPLSNLTATEGAPFALAVSPDNGAQNTNFLALAEGKANTHETKATAPIICIGSGWWVTATNQLKCTAENNALLDEYALQENISYWTSTIASATDKTAYARQIVGEEQELEEVSVDTKLAYRCAYTIPIDSE